MIENEREPTPPCQHTRTVRRVINSEFFKREFLAEVDQCRDCGMETWTRDTQARFQVWMVQLKREKRDLFQIQFYMPANARAGLKDLLRRFPGVPMSHLIRGLTAVYLSSMMKVPGFQASMDGIIERGSYRHIVDGERKKTSIHFNPIALLDIQTWGEVLHLTAPKIVEDALFKSLAMQADPDPGLREMWDRNVLPSIELVLRSV